MCDTTERWLRSDPAGWLAAQPHRAVSKWAVDITGTQGSHNRVLNPLVPQQGFSRSLRFNKILRYPVIHFSSSPKSDDATTSGCCLQEVVFPSEHRPSCACFKTVNDSLCRSKYSFQRLYKALGIKRLYHTHLICVRAGKKQHSKYTLHQ